MRSFRFLSALRTAAIVAAMAPSPHWRATAGATEPFFTGLGDLPGGPGGGFSSSASGVSADGSVVVGWTSSAQGRQAFRWTQEGGIVGLGDLPGGIFWSEAHAVSDDGSVVVGESYYLGSFSPGCGCWQTAPAAFRWTQAGGMAFLGNFGPNSFAYDVSADGSVVVGADNGYQAFRWTPDTGQEFLTGVFGPTGVSADGSVVVGSSDVEAVRWTQAGGGGGLGDLPGGSFQSESWGVSADGLIVVGRSSSATSDIEAFRWTQSLGMIGLGVQPGFDYSWAQDVANGSVIVGYNGIYDSSALDEAFLWDATNGMRSLRDVLVSDFGLGASLAGWTLTSATDISADGQFIVGSGINPDGNTEAWFARLVPVPEPSAMTFVAMMTISIAALSGHPFLRGIRRRHEKQHT